MNIAHVNEEPDLIETAEIIVMFKGNEKSESCFDTIQNMLNSDNHIDQDWNKKIIQKLNIHKLDPKNSLEGLNERDYQALVIWAIKNYDSNKDDDSILSAVLNATLSTHFISVVKMLYKAAVNQGKSQIADRLIKASSYLKNRMTIQKCADLLIEKLSNDTRYASNKDLVTALKSLKEDILSDNYLAKEKLDRDEYKQLLIWAIRSDDESLSIVLNDEFSNANQDTLEMIFLAAIRQGKDEIAFRQHHYSTFLQKIIHSYRGDVSTEKIGMFGQTILQLAAAYNNKKLCQVLLDLHALDLLSKDYYANNCLHYAASSGNEECYKLFLEYSKANNLDWDKQTNIFGHQPIDYLPENINHLTRFNQELIIEKIVQYNQPILSKNTEEIEETKKGLCSGISFLNGLQILRKKMDEDDFSELEKLMLACDDSHAMEKKIEDPKFTQQGFFRVKDVVQYISNHYLFFQNAIKLLDVSRRDRATQLAFVNAGNDKLINIDDYAVENNMTKEEFKNILAMHLTHPNTIMQIFLEQDLKIWPGHDITLIVDSSGKIYFCEPNQVFKPLPIDINEKEKLDTIINVIYNYKVSKLMQLHVGSIHVYQYEASPCSKPRQTIPKYNTFFEAPGDKQFDYAYKLMQDACLKDAPKTLEMLIEKHKDRITDKQLIGLVFMSLTQQNYQCTEVFFQRYNLDRKEMEEKLLNTIRDGTIPRAEVAELLSKYDNYLINKILLRQGNTL